MSAYSSDKKTLAYQLGEALSQMTDHYLLMTATPHKGDPENFCLFLQLLDRDVYGDVKSLEEAMRRQEAPFYLRRVKEALVTFPDPETGEVKALFTKRNVQTTEFQIDRRRAGLLRRADPLRRRPVDQGRGRRFRAWPRARLHDGDAAAAVRVQHLRRAPQPGAHEGQAREDSGGPRRLSPGADRQDGCRTISTICPKKSSRRSWPQLEDVVASVDPAALREEIAATGQADRAGPGCSNSARSRSKLGGCKKLLTEQGIFNDPKMKLLIFTEHKDTLDFLAGDGKDGRPLGKLREWGLTVTQIHGGMKIGDRDTPGTRIYAEREFREDCQVLVATEAAGEGINLQFCWLMINYDIPWNPVRLEQRMGRIHRYGQEKDCLIFNFVTTNTREGRVLHKLFERIEEIEDDLDPKRTGKVFNVLGDVFPANQLEKMLRDMYAHNQMTEELIKQRIVEQVDTERFRQHHQFDAGRTGQARTEPLRHRRQVRRGQGAPARAGGDRGFLPAGRAALLGVHPKETGKGKHIYRIGRVPRNLWPIGERLEPRFGKLGREYKQIVFDKKTLKRRPHAGMGDTRPSAVRSPCAKSDWRARPGRSAAWRSLLRPAPERTVPARRLLCRHPGRPRQRTSSPSVRGSGRHRAAR